MPTFKSDTEVLLKRVENGDRQARDQLWARQRARLRKMVALRLDRRLTARLDPSDVVQEAILEADQMLDMYLKERPLPFYPWLRRLAWKRLMRLCRDHLDAQNRSLKREAFHIPMLADESAVRLGECFLSTGTSPSNRAARQEISERVHAALAEMAAGEREILVLRFVEQLSISETAAVLEISEAAAKMRQARALARLSLLLGIGPGESNHA